MSITLTASQLAIAAEIRFAARNRLQWLGGFSRPLECDLTTGGSTFRGRFIKHGELTIGEDDIEAVEQIAEDAAKYYKARGKNGLAKVADSIRSAIAEKRINNSYLRSFA